MVELQTPEQKARFQKAVEQVPEALKIPVLGEALKAICWDSKGAEIVEWHVFEKVEFVVVIFRVEPQEIDPVVGTLHTTRVYTFGGESSGYGAVVESHWEKP